MTITVRQVARLRFEMGEIMRMATLLATNTCEFTIREKFISRAHSIQKRHDALLDEMSKQTQ